MTPDPTRDLRELPKAHLHLHLEGAMRPSTLGELCRRYGLRQPEDTRGKRFDSFLGFLDMYLAASECVRARADLARLILEVAEDAAAEGVRWLELAYDGHRYEAAREGQPHRLFASQEEAWRFALEAAARAERATGVGVAFISAVDRSRPIDNALDRARTTAALVRAGEHLVESGVEAFGGRHPGIVGVGLHGNEEGFPPEPFEAAFRMALDDTGLLSTPHAGEIAPAPGRGPASVASALDALRADRIMHGVLAIEDPALVERLARARICLDVCPSSNLMLEVFPSMAEHPLPRLMAAGVPCDIGSDDPLLFGPSLLDEYVACREQMGLEDDAIAQLARNSFAFSGAPPAVKAAGIAGVDAWLAGDSAST